MSAIRGNNKSKSTPGKHHQGTTTPSKSTPAPQTPPPPIVLSGTQKIDKFINDLSDQDKNYHRAAFLQFFHSLASSAQQVNVETTEDNTFSGIFHTATPFKSKPFIIAIKCAQNINDVKDDINNFSGPTMLIPENKLKSLSVSNLDLTTKGGSTDMQLDSGIVNKNMSSLNGRDLESVDSSWLDPSLNSSLESSSNIGDWNQFDTNKRLFNVKSTYDESFYTTKLNLANHSKEQIAKAEKLAKEMENTLSDNIHLSEERGHAQQRDMDEEDLYSGVLREPSKKAGDNTTPWKRNQKSGSKQVGSSPNNTGNAGSPKFDGKPVRILSNSKFSQGPPGLEAPNKKSTTTGGGSPSPSPSPKVSEVLESTSPSVSPVNINSNNNNKSKNKQEDLLTDSAIISAIDQDNVDTDDSENVLEHSETTPLLPPPPVAAAVETTAVSKPVDDDNITEEIEVEKTSLPVESITVESVPLGAVTDSVIEPAIASTAAIGNESTTTEASSPTDSSSPPIDAEADADADSDTKSASSKPKEFSFNPQAKEFSFNPKAREFVPPVMKPPNAVVITDKTSGPGPGMNINTNMDKVQQGYYDGQGQGGHLQQPRMQPNFMPPPMYNPSMPVPMSMGGIPMNMNINMNMPMGGGHDGQQLVEYPAYYGQQPGYPGFPQPGPQTIYLNHMGHPILPPGAIVIDQHQHQQMMAGMGMNQNMMFHNPGGHGMGYPPMQMVAGGMGPGGMPVIMPPPPGAQMHGNYMIPNQGGGGGGGGNPNPNAMAYNNNGNSNGNNVNRQGQGGPDNRNNHGGRGGLNRNRLNNNNNNRNQGNTPHSPRSTPSTPKSNTGTGGSGTGATVESEPQLQSSVGAGTDTNDTDTTTNTPVSVDVGVSAPIDVEASTTTSTA